MYCLLAVRHASTETSSMPSGYIPDVPIAPMENLKSSLPELNALGEPTLQSLGLAGNSPPGLVQHLLEWLHVTVDIPWWGAIALGAITLRVILFPAMIYNRKVAINTRNHMPTIARLQAKIGDSRALGNNLEVARRTMELTEYMKRNDVKLRRMFFMPAIQVPLLFSVYLAIRRMSELPVESMKTGGLGWFTDLTVADPFYILPASTALSILLMFELGAESQKAKDLTHTMKWVMRGVPVLVFIVTCKFASGIAFYWSVNNLISLISLGILKQKRVQSFFKIPNEVEHKKEIREKKGFLQGFSEMYENSKLTNEIMKRRQVDETAFKKAGVGPVPKTYRYNPIDAEKKKATG